MEVPEEEVVAEAVVVDVVVALAVSVTSSVMRASADSEISVGLNILGTLCGVPSAEVRGMCTRSVLLRWDAGR